MVKPQTQDEKYYRALRSEVAFKVFIDVENKHEEAYSSAIAKRIEKPQPHVHDMLRYLSAADFITGRTFGREVLYKTNWTGVVSAFRKEILEVGEALIPLQEYKREKRITPADFHKIMGRICAHPEFEGVLRHIITHRTYSTSAFSDRCLLAYFLEIIPSILTEYKKDYQKKPLDNLDRDLFLLAELFGSERSGFLRGFREERRRRRP